MKRKYISFKIRRKLFEGSKGLCQICGTQTRFFKSLYDTPFQETSAGSVDHIIPISLGGSNDENNLRWTCRSCNCSRGNKMEVNLNATHPCKKH